VTAQPLFIEMQCSAALPDFMYPWAEFVNQESPDSIQNTLLIGDSF